MKTIKSSTKIAHMRRWQTYRPDNNSDFRRNSWP